METGLRNRDFRRAVRAAAALAVVLVAVVPSASGQQQSATVSGTLIDRLTRLPVEGARVNVLGTTLHASSDSGGRFDVPGVPGGVRVIQVRAIGYAVSSWMVELGEGQVLRQTFELEGRTLTVDSIAVTRVAVDGWRTEAGFESRRRTGDGHFFTREDIRQRRADNIGDLLRSVPGVITTCRSRGCQVLMPRSTRPCVPDYFLDGYAATFATGPTFPISQVRGVEVYRSRFEVPSEFQLPNQICGVIAIWTIEPGTRLETR